MLRLTRRSAWLGALAAPAAAARAQTAGPAAPPSAAAAPSVHYDAAFAEEARYLPWLRKLGAAADDPKLHVAQLYAQVLAMTGDEAAALAARWAAGDLAPERPAPDLAGAHVEDALEAIARAARGARVVSVSDGHVRSRTRAFAHAVALRLQREGSAPSPPRPSTGPRPPSASSTRTAARS